MWQFIQMKPVLLAGDIFRPVLLVVFGTFLDELALFGPALAGVGRYLVEAALGVRNELLFPFRIRGPKERVPDDLLDDEADEQVVVAIKEE